MKTFSEFSSFKVALRWRQEFSFEKKLFCACSPPSPQKRVISKLRLLFFEKNFQNFSPLPLNDNGQIEHLFNSEHICLYELGEAFPQLPDEKILKNALIISELLEANIPSWVRISKRQIPFSFSPSGIQRSLLIGFDGVLPCKEKKITIKRVLLTETLSQFVRISSNKGEKEPSILLDFFGNPSIEITTDWMEGFFEDLVHCSSKIKDLLAGMGMVRKGKKWSVDLLLQTPFRRIIIANLSSVEQIVSYFTSHGNPFDDEELLPSWCEKKSSLWEFGFWRKEGVFHPIAQIEESWHSSDELEPIFLKGIHERLLEEGLPSNGWKWREYWQRRGDLPEDMLRGILADGKIDLFEKMRFLAPKVPVSLWGELLHRWKVHLQRQGISLEHLDEQKWLSIASLYGLNRAPREILPKLLRLASQFPEKTIKELLKNHLKVRAMSRRKLQELLPQLIASVEPPSRRAWPARERYWMGQLMKYLRGRIAGYLVWEELYRYFSQEPPTPWDRCSFPPLSSHRPQRTFF